MSQKIIALTAENFKRLRAVSIQPDGTLCTISGRNAQGKSSVLDAIQAALGGAKWTPDRPIRDGEEHAKVVLETDELTITRSWSTEGGDRLKIESKTGGRITKPQALLDSLIGGASFDPLAFSKMRPKEQAEELRRIIGLDTSDLDAEREKVYAERTIVNRQVTVLKAKLAGMSVPENLPEPPAEIDISAFFGKLESANNIKTANDRQRAATASIFETLVAKQRQLDLLTREIATLTAEHDKALRTSSALVDPDVAPIRKAVDDAKAHNARVQTMRAARATALRDLNARDMAEDELKNIERLSSHHTARLAEIDAEKAAILAAAKFPVPTLGLDADGTTVTFGGVPFAQASASQQIKVGLQIGYTLNPGIRVLLVRDGSLLDAESLAAVAQWAADADMQVFVERVASDRATGIVIEDGRVKNAPLDDFDLDLDRD